MKNIFEVNKKFMALANAQYLKQERDFTKTAHGFAAWLLLCNQVVSAKTLKPILFSESTIWAIVRDPERTEVYVGGIKMTITQAFAELWGKLDQFDRDMWERAHIVTCMEDVLWCAKTVLEAEGYWYREHQNKTLEEMSDMVISDGSNAAGKYLHYLRYKANENDIVPFYHKAWWTYPEKWAAVWETAKKVTTEAECFLLARQAIQTYAGFKQGELDNMSWDDMLEFTEQEIREVYPFMLYLDEKRTDLVWQPDPYFEGLDK